ncbi:hypothetical protein PGB90_006169 [Kerria lacca]
MNFLQNIRLRSEGCESRLDYDAVFDRFQCTSFLSPPPSIVNSRLLSCSFAKKRKHGHILAVTCEEGQIIILNTKITENNMYSYNINETSEGGNALFSVAWSEIDMKLITTSGNHAVSLWNVHNCGTLTNINLFKAHRCSVKTACFKPQNSEIFASGGRDGNIFVWDARTNNSTGPEQCINNCHKKFITDKSENSSITSLVFQDELKLISCADTDTNIKIWDLRKTYLRNMEKPIPLYQLPSPKKNSLHGYTHMVINKSGSKLFANSSNHIIYCYNVSSFSKTPESTYSGHSVRNFFAKLSLSPDEKYITSTDSDNKIYFWRINSSEAPIIRLSGKSDTLTGLSDISWCPEDPLMLATSSDHSSPWIWTIPSEDKLTPSYSEKKYMDSNSISFVERLSKTHVKCKRNSAMNSISLKNSMKQKELSSMIILPNTVADGYQTHICVNVQKKNKTSNNWLTNLHNQQVKKLIIEKEIKMSPNAKVVIFYLKKFS